MVERGMFMLEKINLNDFKQPFSIDLTEEFNEMKEAYRCQICHNLFVNPVVLNTCRHMLCKGCLDTKLMRCLICKSSYTKTDIRYSNFAETVVHCLQNIEYIFNDSSERNYLVNNVVENQTFLDDKYEIVVAETAMKRNSKGETPLHLACKKGNLAKVEELINSKVDINTTDYGNWSALHEAVQGKHLDCIELLLKNDVIIDTPGVSYVTPLHEAILAKMKDVAIMLLKYGADKKALDSTGHIPLDYISDGQQVAEFESIKPAKKYKPKIFFKKDITVYSQIIDEVTMQLLKSFNVQFTTIQNYRQKSEDNVTHFVILEECLSLHLLLAILKGIFIVNMGWTQVLPPKIYPFEFIPAKYKLTVQKSIQNALEHKPRLFNGIHFHVIDHNDGVQIHETYFTKKDLILLIETGGGNVVSRCPTLSVLQNRTCQPYHADTEHLKQCSDYIIFDESKVHELMYAAKELRHKSSKWLIDCIVQFKILS